jgi:hypothetical protein
MKKTLVGKTVKLYKLTRRNKTTRGDNTSLYSGLSTNTYWEIGKPNRIDGIYRRPILCSNGVFHAYSHPLLASLFRNTHVAGKNYSHLYECEPAEVVVDDGTKVGTYKLTISKRIPLEKLYKKDLRKIAILTALRITRSKAIKELLNDKLHKNRKVSRPFEFVDSKILEVYMNTRFKSVDMATFVYSLVRNRQYTRDYMDIIQRGAMMGIDVVSIVKQVIGE